MSKIPIVRILGLNRLLKPTAALILIGSLWAWKFVEYMYEDSKRGDLLAPTPWGFVISLDVPVFATLGVALAFAGTKVVRRYIGRQ